ncbi:hypothetical protein [Moorena sp. SIO4G3]|uniref:two-partner secretion domain-containing protein n=1 Tax=Moorena sp. SIO4G3 TaxID=2607821 RepID=UPI0025FD578B|nr:hypothetical protein [Moorena sp. SIO4G3]
MLNPNGIVFGANSQLDVAGSFVGSTANSIVFGNGNEFSATNPEEPPLLTINITPGLQYGQNPPQPIVNAGNLAVGQGQNVTLVGGSVISTGDILAPGGEINILAVPRETLVQLGQAGQILTLSTPTVPLTPSDPASVTEFLSSLDHDTGVTVASDAQVILTDSGTQVPVAPGTVIISGNLNAANFSPGETGGKVTVLGDQVGLFEAQLNGGSNVTITTGSTGNQEGNITADGFGITKTTEGEVTLSLQAANDISLKNVDIKASSGLLNLFLEADSDNSGSGDVELMNGEIDTGGGAVTITAAGAIALESFGINRTNKRSVKAPPITVISGESISLKSAGINTFTSGDNGDAGDVIVQTGTLTLENAGIGSRTDGKGNAGQVEVTADSISLIRNAGISSNACLAEPSCQDNAGKTIEGNAGQVIINAGSIVIENSSGFGSDTEGKGNAGGISITADSLSIANNSGFGSIAKKGSTGNGGAITINVSSLSLDNQSGIGANVDGEEGGEAGDITITADRISLTRNSAIDADTNGLLKGGDITITVTDSLFLSGNSEIFTNSSDPDSDIRAQGNAGEIKITAGSVLFENESGLGSETRGNSSGNGGKITITADSVEFTGNSGISTNTTDNSTGNAGQITIHAKSLVLENQSGIGSNTEGNSTRDAGTIIINADSISVENNSNISAQTASGDGGNITLTLQDLLKLRSGSQITTSAGTEKRGGDGGNITITADLIVAFLEEDSDITANAFNGKGGNITLTAQGIFGFNFPDQPTNLSDITASSERGVDGNIKINILDFNPSQGLVELPTTVVDASTLIAASCADNVKVASDDSKGDEFIITGRGGLPPSPLDPIIRQTVIADWVTLDNSATTNYQSQLTPAAREESVPKRPKRRIVEAQGWLIGPDGTVILTAFPTTPDTWANSSLKSPSCEDLRRISNRS